MNENVIIDGDLTKVIKTFELSLCAPALIIAGPVMADTVLATALAKGGWLGPTVANIGAQPVVTIALFGDSARFPGVSNS